MVAGLYDAAVTSPDRNPGGRPAIGGKLGPLQVGTELRAWLDDYAERRGLGIAEAAREVLAEGRARIEARERRAK